MLKHQTPLGSSSSTDPDGLPRKMEDPARIAHSFSGRDRGADPYPIERCADGTQSLPCQRSRGSIGESTATGWKLPMSEPRKNET